MKETSKAVQQLLVLAAIMILGYVCGDKFRFTVSVLNRIFTCAYLLVPFLAIRPVLLLHRWFRIVGFILLTPLLLLSSLLFLGNLVFERGGYGEIREPMQSFQQGESTIELGEYEHGGSVGVHGIYLEQRRRIFPGLLLVKSIDFFDLARRATLFLDGPYRVRVHVEGGYYGDASGTDRNYSLKPWVYF